MYNSLIIGVYTTALGINCRWWTIRNMVLEHVLCLKANHQLAVTVCNVALLHSLSWMNQYIYLSSIRTRNIGRSNLYQNIIWHWVLYANQQLEIHFKIPRALWEICDATDVLAHMWRLIFHLKWRVCGWIWTQNMIDHDGYDTMPRN